MNGSKSTAAEEVENANTFGSLPLLRSERVWTALDFSWVNVALAIATWAFLVGGATASFVGFQQGIAAMIIGNAIGLCFMVLASTVASQRYGVEQYTILRPVFGVAGVGALVFTVVLITEMGWSSLLGIMVGRATTQVASVATGMEFDEYGLMVTLGALVALAVAWYILSRGPITIGRLNKFIAPGLLIITALLMVFLVLNTSWAALLEAAPLAPFDDPQLNFMIAVEFNVAVGVSWYPVMGSLARMTKSPKAAIWPAYGGLLIATLLAQIVGMGAALTLGDSDPTVWMIPFGGPLLGAFILVFICFANITSISSIVYSTVLALRQSSGPLLTGLHWKWLCAGFFVLPALLAFFPQFMYERFVLFVTLSGAFLASMCGAIIVDYFILRKQRIDLAELYAPGAKSAYHLPGGINWAGMIAVIAGAVFYVWIYNPITLETQPLFNVISASLPAAVVGGIVYWILAVVFYKRRGIGGYDLVEPNTVKESR
ncbi:purine-cytosine permease family protein [Arthrobacter sp. TMN-50]